MAMKKSFEAAYLATSYRVFLPGGPVELRIGETNATLRNWLTGAGASSFAILTACNPGSQLCAAELNAERQAQMECELLEGNYEPYTGENVPDNDAGWLEESCFVPDILCEDACALAEDYGQLAIVFGGADGLANLVWIESTEEEK